MRYNNKEGVFK